MTRFKGDALREAQGGLTSWEWACAELVEALELMTRLKGDCDGFFGI